MPRYGELELLTIREVLTLMTVDELKPLAAMVGQAPTKKADLVISTLGKNAEREKVIDFSAAYSPFFQAVFAPKSAAAKSAADLAGKTVGVTRGAIEDLELSKIAPPSADIKRFEDNNATMSAFVSGQVQVIATGASVAGTIMQRNPGLGAELKFVLKDSPIQKLEDLKGKTVGAPSFGAGGDLALKQNLSAIGITPDQ